MSLKTKAPAFLSGPLPEGVSRYDTDRAEIYVWERFMLPSVCRRIANEAAPGFEEATTTVAELQKFRSSKTATLDTRPGTAGAELEAKLHGVMGHPLTHSDLMQANLYEKGGQYPDHYDFLMPGAPGCDEEISDGGHRTWTFILYLNTVKEGGGTRFSRIGAEFRAKAGRALLWNNLLPDGSPNPMTLHAGLPVTKGRKLIVTKWFREEERSVQAEHVAWARASSLAAAG